MDLNGNWNDGSNVTLSISGHSQLQPTFSVTVVLRNWARRYSNLVGKITNTTIDFSDQRGTTFKGTLNSSWDQLTLQIHGRTGPLPPFTLDRTPIGVLTLAERRQLWKYRTILIPTNKVLMNMMDDAKKAIRSIAIEALKHTSGGIDIYWPNIPGRLSDTRREINSPPDLDAFLQKASLNSKWTISYPGDIYARGVLGEIITNPHRQANGTQNGVYNPHERYKWCNVIVIANEWLSQKGSDGFYHAYCGYTMNTTPWGQFALHWILLGNSPQSPLQIVVGLDGFAPARSVPGSQVKPFHIFSRYNDVSPKEKLLVGGILR